jgi:phytoene synthase
MSKADTETARRTASGSSFYWAMRLLPPEKREAMYAIYRFCRAVDDIADEATAPDSSRTTELQAWRDAIAALYRGESSGNVGFLQPPVQHFALRERDFLSVIDGMEMDASGTMIAPDVATLGRYCDCVASAVGRLSIKVFGMEEEPGFALAHHLGRALQLTNILRDLDEDAELGRLYLPNRRRVRSHTPVLIRCAAAWPKWRSSTTEIPKSYLNQIRAEICARRVSCAPFIPRCCRACCSAAGRRRASPRAYRNPC